jgi:hypothetical protein
VTRTGKYVAVWWIPRYIQGGAAFARHSKLGLHTANELIERRLETIFAASFGVALACTEMAQSKTGLLVWNVFIDFSPRNNEVELRVMLFFNWV